MTQASFGPVRECMNCRSWELVPVVFLGYLPPVSTMDPLDAPLGEETKFPAEVLYCGACSLVQIGYIVDPAVLFHSDYTYTSGTTRSIRENFADLCRRASARFGLSPSDLVVDIGSNDGTLLSNFMQAGHRVCGIEPTDVGDLAVARGIPTVKSFLTPEAVERVGREHGPAKLVTATNVFAHMPDVANVMACIGDMLTADGVFVSESDYLRDIVETIQYDTIHHEHLRYYSVTSLAHLMGRNGFRIIHVERIPTHGGSIRVYATRDDGYAQDPSVAALLEEERNLGLAGDGWIERFRARVTKSKLAFYALLERLDENGASPYGIGAPARAATLLNYLGLDRDIVPCVLEVNGSKKIGHYMPGTRIPVHEERRLFEDQPPYALILSWHIADELCAVLKKKGYRGDFIVPLPEPRVIRNADVPRRTPPKARAGMGHTR